MPNFEVFINAGIILPDIEAEDRDDAREKALKEFNDNKHEYGYDLQRNSEIVVYEKEDD